MKILLKIGKMIIRIVLLLVGLLALLTVIVAGIYLAVNRTNGKIESSGRIRKYLLYVPESYDPATPAPLVISMHGFAEWPAHQMRISHWNDVADEHGFIVVYPSGTQFPLRWNAYNWQGTRIDANTEVQFISDLIDKLSDDYNIDPTRIYANGLSNGGGMSVLLACRLSERIAAIGSVSGAYLLPWDQCVQSRLVPIIAFHGTEDPIVPYKGGGTSRSGSSFPNIPTWITSWVQRYGCDPTPVDLPAHGEVSGEQYTHCNQNADVVFYIIHGGGHAWPGGGSLPKFIVGHTTQDIDATRVMWEFFSRYTLEE
jgi:polyhydroxybutyrate depolymerase